MTFKTSLFGRPKRRRVMGIMINIVVTGGARVLQLLNMEAVRNRDTIGIDLRRSTFHIKNTRMATNAVRIDLIQFSGKPSVLPFAVKRKDIDARHQGVAGGMAFRTVDLGMNGRLLPERGFTLLAVTGDTEFLFGRGIGRECNRRIHTEDDQNAP
jgi:hypothetical protein